MLPTHSFTGEEILRKFSKARHSFGMIRIESGVLLFLIKKHKLWRGRAESFSKFLNANQLSLSGANQFVKVAEKFYFELGVRDENLSILAKCSMSVLVKASEKVNKDNLQDVLMMLDTLNEDDIRIELENISSDEKKFFHPVEKSQKLVEIRQVMETMSHEELVALRNEIWTKTRGK